MDPCNYEEYTIQELTDEFASVIPCFFKSFNELYKMYCEDHLAASIKIMLLASDLLAPPTAHRSVHIISIIHCFFNNLPWTRK